MFRGGTKRAQFESEIELEERAVETSSLLVGVRAAKVSTDSLWTVETFLLYLSFLILPVAKLLTGLAFLALISDSKVLSCFHDVTTNSLEEPRYVKRAPPKLGVSLYACVLVSVGCSLLHLLALSCAAFLHLRSFSLETHPASLAFLVNDFLIKRSSAQPFAIKAGGIFDSILSLAAAGCLLLASTSFSYWVGGGSTVSLAAGLVGFLSLLDTCSAQILAVLSCFFPVLKERFKASHLHIILVASLLVTTCTVVSVISGPLLWAIVNGQDVTSLQNLAVKVEVQCGPHETAGQTYELLLDGVIRSGPSHETNATLLTPFEEARSTAVLRFSEEAYFVNALESSADPKSVPQWTLYSDEFWSIFHGGVPPNLLSFKASFWLTRSHLLASIHVPQAPAMQVAYPYSRDGQWETADVSLTSVHSNLQVLCPQVASGMREFSSRTFPTNLSQLQKLRLSVALLGTYCPAERERL